jgi:7-cyano-7-deazaguanine synthase
MKAIVLLSGGLDSSTCATIAQKEQGKENVLALSFDYGQRHRVELEAAKAVSDYLGIKHYIQSIPKDIFGNSALTGVKEIPQKSYEELTGVSPVYVPFRNGIFLSIATAIALKEGAEYIYFGPHATDARNFAYPDCTFEFSGAMANAIYMGTYHKVRLVTPLQWLTKTEVVKLGLLLNTPFHLTHSCYKGKPACGKCPTCLERLKAFKQAGVKDPIEYANE